MTLRLGFLYQGTLSSATMRVRTGSVRPVAATIMTAQTECEGERLKGVRQQEFRADSTRSGAETPDVCVRSSYSGSTEGYRAGKAVFMLLTGSAKLLSLDKT